MKFSELIRKGAKETKPLRNGELAEVIQGQSCACAIGAAATAKEPRFPLLSSNVQMEFVENEFPEMTYGHPTMSDMEDIPDLTSFVGWTYYAVIGLMNDEGVMTREEIADWRR